MRSDKPINVVEFRYLYIIKVDKTVSLHLITRKRWFCSSVDRVFSQFNRSSLKIVLNPKYISCGSIFLKMGRISEYVKLRIHSNFVKGRKICEAVRDLKDNDNIEINRNTVSRWYTKFRNNGSLADKKGSGRPSLVKRCHMDFIDMKLEENDELTAKGVKLHDATQPTIVYSIQVTILESCENYVVLSSVGYRFLSLRGYRIKRIKIMRV